MWVASDFVPISSAPPTATGARALESGKKRSWVRLAPDHNGDQGYPGTNVEDPLAARLASADTLLSAWLEPSEMSSVVLLLPRPACMLTAMLNNLRIGVVLPAYNAEATLARTLDELDRTSIDEVVLVDDASTDRTVEPAPARPGADPPRAQPRLRRQPEDLLPPGARAGRGHRRDAAPRLPVLAAAGPGDGGDDRLRRVRPGARLADPGPELGRPRHAPVQVRRQPGPHPGREPRARTRSCRSTTRACAPSAGRCSLACPSSATPTTSSSTTRSSRRHRGRRPDRRAVLPDPLPGRLLIDQLAPQHPLRPRGAAHVCGYRLHKHGVRRCDYLDFDHLGVLVPALAASDAAAADPAAVDPPRRTRPRAACRPWPKASPSSARTSGRSAAAGSAARRMGKLRMAHQAGLAVIRARPFISGRQYDSQADPHAEE